MSERQRGCESYPPKPTANARPLAPRRPTRHKSYPPKPTANAARVLICGELSNSHRIMPVLPGLDALSDNAALLARLRGKRLGLLTNPTGVTRDGAPALAVLHGLNLDVVTLFSPEHGPRADREGDIESGRSDEGLPLHSLYGATRRPVPAMLDGLDAIVIDLQDVGARFYTYATTMFHLLEACAPRGIAVVILDRPNPLGGACEGPIIEASLQSFVGPAPLPITHGLTMAELARWFVNHANLEVEVLVSPVAGWARALRWPQTGLQWRRPSPNLPDFAAAAWYPGLCLLEFCDFSVGRGTNAPFQILAAPDFPAPEFVARWESKAIVASLVEVTPAHAKFAGETCAGVHFTGAPPVSPVAFGLEVMTTLRAAHPDWPREDFDKAAQLIGSRAVVNALWNDDLATALATARMDANAWKDERAGFLIY